MDNKKSNFWSEFDKFDNSHQEGRKKFFTDVLPNLTFEQKLEYSKEKVREFIKYCEFKKLPFPVISFSGGRDSTILWHLVRNVVKENKLKFKPTIIVASEFFHPDNVKIIKKFNTSSKSKIIPAVKTFSEVITTIGFPIISKELSQKIRGVLDVKVKGKWIATCFGYGKGRAIPEKYLHLLDTDFCNFKPTHECCNLIKGGVKHDTNPKFIGTTIFESELRKTNWLTKGCNIFDEESPISRPISLWNDEDVKKFIELEKIKISDAYQKGWTRTGCMFCGFGLNIEDSIKQNFLRKSVKEDIQLIKNKLPKILFKGDVIKNIISRQLKSVSTKHDIKKIFINVINRIEKIYEKDKNEKYSAYNISQLRKIYDFSILFNRIELVKVYFLNVYNMYMHGLGNSSLLHPFINSYIKIENDSKYMNSFLERERERSKIDMIF
ncbi:MAG: phosphoadenosine phosphosulfate reductase family protein [Mycoplasmataceae bacterium]|nr:phosphoadenosine phosphosulfate reductase family protein [Mycoplasmataceae bacterium]